MVTKTELGITEGNWVNQQPSDLDYLKPNGFKFQIHNLPNVSYFCQAANIPAIQIGAPEVETPLSKIPLPGDKLNYGDLVIRFLVQENMRNYTELYNWLIGLGFPNNHDEYTNWNKSQAYRFPAVPEKRLEALGNFSDADFFILDSDNNPNVKITYYDVFPISLEGLDFDISTGQANFLQGIAAFKYRHYDITVL
jgi:hypothetical protein